MAGLQECAIKRLLGHASSDVTQKHYTAAVLSTVRDAVEKIDLGIDPAVVGTTDANTT